ncbi:MAG: ABC transporter ATP-binding protein [Sumerlaeia bacterium]
MIELEGVSKRFRLYRKPLDRISDWMGWRARYQDFWALSGIDLRVPSGRAFGIVGPNGAGKSTLLKIITGTLIPTAGDVRVEGRVAALLELGTGFHGEFTGRQNIWINGQLLGLSHDEIAEQERDIIAFSELGRFIDQPLRTYSSGMVVRLGFSVAAATNPDVLIIDEALSVGDARFAQKCIRRIRQFRENGATILFVSHDPNAVLALCDEAVLLDQGQIANRGTPSDVLEHYNALLATRGAGNVEMSVRWASSSDADRSAPRRSGTFQALITGLDVLDDHGDPAEVFAVGATMRLRIRAVSLAPISNPTIGFLIRDRLGMDVFGTNTARMGLELGDFSPGEAVTLTCRVPLDIGDGDYSITVAIHSEDTHLEDCYDWTDNGAAFRVVPVEEKDWHGVAHLKPILQAIRDPQTPGALSAALAQVFPSAPDPLSAQPEPGAPNPFLSGFFSIEGHDPPLRWTGPRATFVMAPRAPRLALALGIHGREAGAALTVRLAVAVTGWEQEWTATEELSVLTAELPPDSVGAPVLFELSIDPPFVPGDEGDAGNPPRTLGAAFYGARTLDEWETAPEWPAMIQSCCSRTSNAT